MSSVDERVVAMRFQNSQFMDGVKNTLSALESLKSGLSGKLSASGLEEMSKQTTGISAKMLALGAVGVTAIAGITNKAMEMGGAFLKSVTGVEAMADGFAEYELKMGSIQTMLANTAKQGTKLSEINTVLDDLNIYADKTVYNFGQMTQAIGQLTATGKGVEESSTLVKGFANWAAAAGVGAGEMAGAMVQLNQGMQTGTIKLQDWMSLEKRGMVNKNSTEGLYEVANSMGVFAGNAKLGSLAQNDFRSSLAEGWLSADVMSQYLKIMSNDMTDAEWAALNMSDATKDMLKQQAKTAYDAATKVRTFTDLIGTLKEGAGSGWTATFEGLIGDFDEATNLFTYVSDKVGGILDSMSETRNNMIAAWKEKGGWSDLWGEFDANGVLTANGALQNLFDTVKNITAPIREAWKVIFPPSDGSGLKVFTAGLKNVTAVLEMVTKPVIVLKPIFLALFGVLKLGWSILKGVLGLFGNLLGLFVSVGTGGVLSFAGAIGNLINKFVEWVQQGQYIERFFATLNGWLSTLLAPMAKIGQLIAEAFQAKDLSIFTDGLKGAFSDAAPAVQKVVGLLTSFVNGLKGIYSIIAKGDFLGSAMTFGLEEDSGFVNFLFNVRDAFVGVDGAASKVKNSIKQVVDGFQGITAILTKGDFLGSAMTFGLEEDSGFVNFLFNVREGILGIGDAGAESSGKMSPFIVTGDKVRSGWDKVVDAFQAIKEALGPVMSALGTAFNWIKQKFQDFFAGKGMIDVAALMQGGIFIMLWRLRDVFEGFGDFGRLGSSISGVFDALGESLGDFADGMKKQATAKIILNIGIALGILAAAVLLMTLVDPAKLGLSIGALTVAMAGLFAIVSAVSKLSETSGVAMMKMGVSISLIAGSVLIMATAILTLSAAVAIFGAMDVGTLAKGLGSVAVAMGIMVGALKLLSGFNSAGVVAAGAAMILMATAMSVMSGAVAIFGNMDLVTLAKGLGATGIALSQMTNSLLVLGAIGPAVMAGGAALMLVSGALVTLALALGIMGKIGLADLVKGMAAMGIALTGMTAALVVLGLIGPMVLVGAAAIGVLTASMMLFALIPWPVLAAGLVSFVNIMAMMDWSNLFKTVGVLVLLSVGFLALGAAAVVLGAGLLLAGAGMFLFATGFALLATAGAAGTAVLITAITAVASMLPMIAGQLGLAMLSFADAISKGGPAIVAALDTVFDSLIQAASANLDPFLDLVMNFIMGLIERVTAAIPEIADAGLEMILGFLDALNERLPDIIEAGGELIVNFIDGISNNINSVVDAAGNLIVSFIDGISNNLNGIIDSGTNLVVSLINGISNNLSRITTAATDLIVRFLTELGNNSTAIIEAGTALVITLIRGVGDAAADIVDAAGETILKFLNAVDASVVKYSGEISQAGMDIVGHMISGLGRAPLTAISGIAKKIGNGLINGVKGILGIHSPSKVFQEIGEYVTEGFALGISGSSDNIENAFDVMQDKLEAALEKAKRTSDSYRDEIKKQGDIIAKDTANKNQLAKNNAEIAKIRAAGNDDIILDFEQKRLDELARENKNLQKTISDNKKKVEEAKKAKKTAQANLTESISEEKKLQKALTQATTGLDKSKAKLQGMADDYDVLIDKLNEANKALEDITRTRDEANKSYFDSFSILPSTDDQSNFESYVDSLQKQITDTIKFNETLSALRDLGLDDKTYKMLLEKGVASQALMEDILAQGAGGVDTINTLTENLDLEAMNLADKASKELYQAGVDAAQGLVDGLAAQSDALKAQMDKLAQSMVDSIKKQLGIKSPSRVFKEIGGYATEGLAAGLEQNTKDVDAAAGKLGDSATEALREALANVGDDLDGTIKMEPVIKPILDLTQIRKDASGINGVLGSSGLNVGTSAASANAIAAKQALAAERMSEFSGENVAPIQFIQNNTSPKSLSNAEIYRQTKNQLSATKEALPY